MQTAQQPAPSDVSVQHRLIRAQDLARKDGFVWALILVATAWVAWNDPLGLEAFLRKLGLHRFVAALLARVVWGGILFLVLQRGLAGETVLRAILTRLRERKR
jgi:hypothetical protein